MSDHNKKPRCSICGKEMYMTRFQSDVSPQGIKGQHLYECLWCGADEVVHFVDKAWMRASTPEQRVE